MTLKSTVYSSYPASELRAGCEKMQLVDQQWTRVMVAGWLARLFMWMLLVSVHSASNFDDYQGFHLLRTAKP